MCAALNDSDDTLSTGTEHGDDDDPNYTPGCSIDSDKGVFLQKIAWKYI